MAQANPESRFSGGVAVVDGKFVPVAEARLPLLYRGFTAIASRASLPLTVRRRLASGADQRA